MKTKIKILIAFLLAIPFSVSAFTFIGADMFKSPVQKFFEKVWQCTWHVSCYTAQNVGSFTELTSATVISSFPTVYNANLAKTIEVGTTTIPSITTLSGLTTATSLASVGAITTGTWSATAIAVAKGGTGTTSPTATQVMVGNGASGLKVIGNGTSGQFLTSGGASVDPSWTTAAINEAGTYTWSGPNMWTASTTHNATTSIAASSVTNNALNLNGLNYSMPSTRAASSTVLSEDGSGNLRFVPMATCFTGQRTEASTVDATTTITHNLGVVPTYFSATGDHLIANSIAWSAGTGRSQTSQNSTYTSLTGTTAAHGASTGAYVLEWHLTNDAVGATVWINNITSTTADLSYNWISSGGNSVYNYTFCK